MTRAHPHGGPSSPEEDADIAREAMDEGDYSHAANHLAGALAAELGKLTSLLRLMHMCIFRERQHRPFFRSGRDYPLQIVRNR